MKIACCCYSVVVFFAELNWTNPIAPLSTTEANEICFKPLNLGSLFFTRNLGRLHIEIFIRSVNGTGNESNRWLPRATNDSLWSDKNPLSRTLRSNNSMLLVDELKYAATAWFDDRHGVKDVLRGRNQQDAWVVIKRIKTKHEPHHNHKTMLNITRLHVL